MGNTLYNYVLSILRYMVLQYILVCGSTVGGSNVFSSTVGEYGSVVYSRNRDDSTVYHTSEK